MFFQILEFLVLVALASTLVGGVMIVRRMAEVVALRSKLEGTKTKRQIAEVENSLRIEEFQYGQRVLALTTGAESADRIESGPMEVRADEVIDPKEHPDDYRLRNAAVNAEYQTVR